MKDDRTALEVLSFWWDAGPGRWFSADPAFDADCIQRFSALQRQAADGDLDTLAETPHGMLALIILTDQMPRNMFRGTARAFATDWRALALAEAAIEKGFPAAYPMPARGFFFLPLMHAEDLAVQTRCVDLYRVSGDKETFHYALMHYEAIARFGRFPHRNALLGRESTPAELAYLDGGGFRG
jgi:uncharacterized protein (DUF924 family)